MNPSDQLSNVAADFVLRRYAAELDLAGAMLADPSKGLQAAKAAGFDLAIIDRPDVQIILTALNVTVQSGNLQGDRLADQHAVADSARRELQAEHYWYASNPICFFGNLQWSDVTLAALFDGFFHSDSLIAQRVAWVADFHQRWIDSNAFYAAAMSVLAEPEADKAEQSEPDQLTVAA